MIKIRPERRLKRNLCNTVAFLREYKNSAADWKRKWKRAEKPLSGHESGRRSSCNRTQLFKPHAVSRSAAMSSTREAPTES
ncbi:hypothetical protein AMELA_G00252030 [Ameiurus melas]|uniref:Uncharacterized protein n=1 Tax=Ameiurus melas TaxID=219545 RepID=A0A7J5ZT54_AMEME|nr:hypothetical protein AMELA_G00252030 [Ameiurus melas]